jgi:hypothetical protein
MRIRLLFAVAVVISQCCGAFAQAPVKVSDAAVVANHRIDAERPLPIKSTQDHAWPPYVRLELTVAADGSVTSAIAREGDRRYYDAAARAALDWTYKPFLRDGTPVSVTFSEYVRIVPPERRPATHTPFPEIEDWNSLKISLERTACFGMCPDYLLEVRGDGTVRYTGRQYVRFCGEWKGEVPLESVRQLVDQFRAADYFSLFPEYEFLVTDNPAYMTSIQFDGKEMSVRDYVGEDVGMPFAVRKLEDAIDRIAGPEQWTVKSVVPPEVDGCDASIPIPIEKPRLPGSLPPETARER